MKVLLVHNPGAGDDDHSGDHLVELIERAGHTVEYRPSKGDWAAVLEQSPHLVAVAGGDGTVSEVAKAAARIGVPVTILPAGTANNIAGALGLQGVSHQKLVAGWNAGALQPFDVGVARGPWGTFEFLESVGIGALAAMMRETDQGSASHVNKLEDRDERIAAATDVLADVVRTMEGIPCEVTVDGMRTAGCYLLVEALNFGAAGPGVRLSPRADGADGKLDVVLVSDRERSVLLERLQGQARSTESAWPIHHATHVVLEYARSPLHLDDELFDAADERLLVDMSIRPGAITFLIPRMHRP